jgi:hypothetical protein
MKVRCEDAPCCGCCGTNLYGVNQEADDDPITYYCDDCGFNHVGPCPYEEDDEEVT